jgi:nucleoside-diphosphate-sugar epimerase
MVRDASAHVAVTGSTGRLGTAVVRRLVAGGATVVAFDRRPTPDPGGPGRVVQTVCDLSQPDALAKGMESCSAVIHLAGLVPTGATPAPPGAYVDANTLGTAVAAEASARAGVPRLVLASTSHVYGTPDGIPVSEEAPVRPASPYAWSKLAAEAVAAGFAAGGGAAAAVVRLGNLYGFLPADDTVIGRAVGQVLRGERLRLRSLDDVRDFTYVDDAAEALVRLAGLPGDVGTVTVNVSTGHGVSVREMAMTLARLAGHDPADVEAESAGGPATTIVLNVRRLAALTGWTPPTSIEAGLRQTLRARAKDR